MNDIKDEIFARVDDSDFQNALYLAIENNKLGIIEYIILNYPESIKYLDDAIEFAVENGQVDAFIYLAQIGDQFDVRPSDGQVDSIFETALYYDRDVDTLKSIMVFGHPHFSKANSLSWIVKFDIPNHAIASIELMGPIDDPSCHHYKSYLRYALIKNSPRVAEIFAKEIRSKCDLNRILDEIINFAGGIDKIDPNGELVLHLRELAY